MSEDSGEVERERAETTREYQLLCQKTVSAREDLARLHQQISASQATLSEHSQMQDMAFANQQLVLTLLAMQAKPEPPPESGTVNRDIRQANEKLVISALKAQDLQARAELAFAHQKNALTTVAHELRNPLTPIGMIAERMVRVPSKDLPQMQALIQDQIKYMSRLIEDLLDVSRVDRGRLTLELSDVDIVKVLEDVIGACQAMMSKAQLQFSATVPAGPLSIHGDPIRLAQVLHNLLTNAGKYTPKGGTVQLAAEERAGQIRISVRDNGIGISSEFLSKVFQPYARDKHAMSFDRSGLGIGLTVVQELVEAHGGSVVCHSEGEGCGSEFIVTLPLKAA